MEVSHTNFCQKLCNSLGAVVCGCVMVPICMVIIGWNEMNAVCTQKSYDDAKDHVVETNCRYSSANDNDFVHYTCDVDTQDPWYNATDDAETTAYVPGGYKLTVVMEIYSWSQNDYSKTVKDSVGGGDTTYHCSCWRKTWSTSPMGLTLNYPVCNPASEAVKHGLASCPNGEYDKPVTPYQPTPSPGDWNVGSKTYYATRIPLGKNSTEFMIPREQIKNITNQEVIGGSVRVNRTVLETQGFDYVTGDMYYTDYDPSDPDDLDIGRMRISFRGYRTSTMSAVGQQTGLKPATLRAEKFGGSSIPPCSKQDVITISTGTKSAETLFKELKDALNALTWVLRFLMFFGLWLAFYLCMKPLTVMPDIIPCIGPMISEMAECVVCLMSCGLGTWCWLVVTGLCFLFYRPAIGAGMLVVGCCVSGGVMMCKRSHDKQRDTGIQASYTAV